SPHKSLSVQFSTGRLNNPEALDPTLDTVRTTASAHHDLQFSSGHISSSFIWGRNKDLKNGARSIFNSYNFEMTSQLLRRNCVWTRVSSEDVFRSFSTRRRVWQPSRNLRCVPPFPSHRQHGRTHEAHASQLAPTTAPIPAAPL